MSLAFLRTRPVGRPRVRPAFEPLECRVNPVVTVTPSAQTLIDEGQPLTYVGDMTAGPSPPAPPRFTVTDTGAGSFVAGIVADQGTITIDPLGVFLLQVNGATIVGDGSSSVNVSNADSNTIRQNLFGSLGNKFVLTPNAFYSGDATVAVTGFNVADAATGTGTHQVGIRPVAQTPTVTGTPVNGFTDADLPFDISTAALADTDGSEGVQFADITGYPAGTTFSAGSEVVPGVWRVPAAGFAGLTVRVPAAAAGNYLFNIAATNVDTATITVMGTGPTVFTDSRIGTVEVGVDVRQPPVVDVVAPPVQTLVDEGVSVVYSGSIDPQFEASDTGDPSGPMRVVITATNGTLTLSDVIRSAVAGANGTITGEGTDTVTIEGVTSGFVLSTIINEPGDTFVFTPTPFFSGDAAVTLSLANLADGTSDSATDPVGVRPVAQPPNMFGSPIDAEVGTAVPFPIGVVPNDPDGSELVRFADIIGYPPGVTFSAGMEISPGVWRVGPADFVGLQLIADVTTPPGSYSLTAVGVVEDLATITLVPGGPQPFADVNSSSIGVPLNILLPPPVFDGPGGGETTENGTFPLTGLTVTDVVPSFVAVTYDFPGGVVRPIADPFSFGLQAFGVGTSTLTLTGPVTAVNDFINSTGVRLVPGRFNTGDLFVDLQVNTFDGRFDTRGFNLRVTPLAETPILSTPAALGGVARAAVSLPILLGTRQDPDPTTVTVSGLPSGSALSAGTDLGGGVYRFETETELGQLPGLQLLLPGVPAEFTLTVVAQTRDAVFFPSLDETIVVTSPPVTATIPVRLTPVNPNGPAVSLTGPNVVSVNENNPQTNASFTFNQFNAAPFVIGGGFGPNEVLTATVRVDRGNVFYVDAPGVVVNQVTNQLFRLTGTQAALNNGFANSGILYFPEQFYSGDAYLAVDVAAPDGSTSGTAAGIRVLPVAEDPPCGYVPPFLNFPFNPSDPAVPFPAFFVPTQDQDGSEEQFVEITGLPAELSFSAGSPGSITGSWRVAAADLPGLVLYNTSDSGIIPRTFTASVTFVNEDSAEYTEPMPDRTDRRTLGLPVQVSIFPSGTPLVLLPGPVSTPQDTAFDFVGPTAVTFSVFDPTTANATVRLTPSNGVLSLLGSSPGGVTVTGTGTPADPFELTAVQEEDIFDFLLNVGVRFTPDAGFAGEAAITVFAEVETDSGFRRQTDLRVITVTPEAPQPVVNGGGSFPTGSAAPFVVPAGTLTVGTLPPGNPVTGLFYFVRLSLTGASPLPPGFRIQAGPFAPVDSTFAFYNLPDTAAIQNLLDTISITPPVGFSGEVQLTAEVQASRTAFLPSQCTTIFDDTFAAAAVSLRFFGLTQAVGVSPTDRPEGSSIDLLGRVALFDPDRLAGDTHTVSLQVSRGTLSLPGGPPPGVSVGGNGTGLLFLSGDLPAIQSLFFTPGAVVYTPDDPFFAGFVRLDVALVNESFFPAFANGFELLALTPVAQGFTPGTFDAETVEDQPVPLQFVLLVQFDQDGSESRRYEVRGVPAGASLSAGTTVTDPMTGETVWVLTEAELQGVTFTPPPGFPPAPPSGTITLQVRLVATDVFDPTIPPPPDTALRGPASGTRMPFGPDVFTSADVPLAVTVAAVSSPVLLSPPSAGVFENRPEGSFVTQVFAGGGRPGESFTFALDTNRPAPPFDFTVASDGTIRVGTISPDFESLQFNGSAVFTLPLLVTGSRGTVEAVDYVIRVFNENEGPVIGGPTAFAGPEGQPLTIAGLTVGDPDAFGNPIRVSVQAFSGTLAVPTAPPSVIVDVAPDGRAVVLVGTQSDLNALLAAGLTYTPDPGFVGREFVSVEVNDMGNTSDLTPLPLTASATLFLTVEPVAADPVLTASMATGTEDVPTPLALTAAPGDPDEPLELFVSGLPAGFALSAGTLIGPGHFRLTPAELTGLTLVAPADFSGQVVLRFTGVGTKTFVDDEIGLTLTDTAVVTRLVPVVVRPQAGTPVPTASAAPADQGQPVPLTLAVTRGDPTDTDETLELFLDGVPAGFVLSAGTDRGSGRWELTPADLPGLRLVPPADFSGPLTLVFRARQLDSIPLPPQTDSQTASATFQVFVRPLAAPPALTAPDVTGTEDVPVPLQLTAAPGRPDETLDLFVENVPAGFTLTAGTDLGGGRFRVTPADLPTLALVPPVDFSGTLAGTARLLFRGVETRVVADPNGGPAVTSTAEAGVFFVVTIRPAAGVPVPTAPDAAGDQGQAVPLQLSVARGDPSDTDETLDVFLDNVPAGFFLSAGTNLGGGTWRLTAADLAGLAIVPPANFSGTLALTLRAVQTDTAGDGSQTDTRTAAERFEVTVNPRQAVPVVTARNAAGDEGGTILLDFAVTPVDGGGAAVVRVTGLPAGFTLSAGARDSETGDIVLTPDQLPGLTLFAPQDTGGRTIDLMLTALQAGQVVSQPFTLTVANVAPVLTDPDAPDATAGRPVTIDLGSFADPGQDAPWRVTVEFGDGTSQTFTVQTPGDLGTVTHTYATAGEFTVTVRVFDGTVTDTAATTVAVTDPAVAADDDDTDPTVADMPEDIDFTFADFPTFFLDDRFDDDFDGLVPEDPEAPEDDTPDGGFGGTGATATPTASDIPLAGGTVPGQGLPVSSRSEVTAAGSPFSRAAAEAAAFGAGRERHPLPPVLPLDPGSPAGAFGDAGGDSLSLVERLYARPQAPGGGGGGGEESDSLPEDSGEWEVFFPEVGYDVGNVTVETVDPPADGRSGGLAVWIGLAVVGAAAAGLAATGPPKTAACRPRLGVHHLRPDEDLP